MTLLISIFASVISTVVWYKAEDRREMKLGVLCFLFWGSSLMWLIDAVFEYIELGSAFFSPEISDMLNDFYLGLSVVALSLVIWIVILLIKDPKGVIRKNLKK